MHSTPPNLHWRISTRLAVIRQAAPRFLCAALLLSGWQAHAQLPSPPREPAASAARARAVPASAPRTPVVTKPEWKELSPGQQRALQPLTENWSSISEGQKRKWLALSVNFEKLPAPEQAKLHERMKEWAALSASQRNQARLNFAETKKLPPEERQAKWQAYQALSEDEKQKLAQRAPKPPAGAATAIKPVAKQKLVNVPVDHHTNAPQTPPMPHLKVDRNTLLPQQP